MALMVFLKGSILVTLKCTSHGTCVLMLSFYILGLTSSCTCPCKCCPVESEVVGANAVKVIHMCLLLLHLNAGKRLSMREKILPVGDVLSN